MIEITPLTVGIALITGMTLGHLVGKRWADEVSEGCNGHHWGEPNTTFSARAAHDAGIDDMWDSTRAVIQGSEVVVYEDAVQRCEDCGDVRATEVVVGRQDIEDLHEP
jgi:hypothetical protein